MERDFPLDITFSGVAGCARIHCGDVSGKDRINWSMFNFLDPSERKDDLSKVKYSMLATAHPKPDFNLEGYQDVCTKCRFMCPLEMLRYPKGGIGLLFPPFVPLKNYVACYGQHIPPDFHLIIKGILQKILYAHSKGSKVWITPYTIVVPKLGQRGEDVGLLFLDGNRIENPRPVFHPEDFRRFHGVLSSVHQWNRIPPPLKFFQRCLEKAWSYERCCRLLQSPLFWTKYSDKWDFVKKVYSAYFLCPKFAKEVERGEEAGWRDLLVNSKYPELLVIYKFGKSYEGDSHYHLIRFLRNYFEHASEGNKQLQKLQLFKDLAPTELKLNDLAFYLNTQAGDEIASRLRIDTFDNLVTYLSVVNEADRVQPVSRDHNDFIWSTLIDPSFCDEMFLKTYTIRPATLPVFDSDK